MLFEEACAYLKLILECVLAMLDTVFAKHIVQSRSCHMLHFKELLVSFEFLKLEVCHMHSLCIDEVASAHIQQVMECLKVFLSIKENLPNAVIQEGTLEDT